MLNEFYRVHVVCEISDVKDDVEIFRIRFASETRYRLSVDESEISENGESRRPVGIRWDSVEPICFTPRSIATALVIWNKLS